MTTSTLMVYLDLLFGDRDGFVATAFGSEPYRDERGRYRHREWRELRFPWPADRASLVRSVEQELATGDPVDIYVCPALRLTDARSGFGGQKGTNSAPPRALWADLDQPPDVKKLTALEALIVDSGQPGHCHPYVLLKESVPVPTHRALNRALADYLGADAKWSDDALLRLPGTLNFKPAVPPAGVSAGPPRPVQITMSPARTWSVRDIATMLDVDLAAVSNNVTSKVIAPFRGNAEPAPDPLPPLVLWALHHGDVADRSKAHARLVGACVDAGLTLGQTVTVCSTYGPSAEKYSDRLPDEVARFWAKASAERAGSHRCRRRTVAAPPTRAALVGLLRKVLNAPADEQPKLEAWAVRKLHTWAAAGQLDPVYVSNVAEQLGQAVGGSR